MVSDAELVGAILEGDTGRYGELVSRHQAKAWKLAYSFVGNFEDAKELSQNGFVKAYLHLREFRGKARFSTWLYRIIVNECKDFLKKKARQPGTFSLSQGLEDEEIPLEIPDPKGDPRSSAFDREVARQLARRVKELPMNQRTAFVLRHFQGLSLLEVSEAMGCRVGTVKAHLFRATEHLRICLKPLLGEEAGR
ncbi:MAG: sigma-70 family RNA polymerase sigma factor [Candidatus Omnitrophica bacterium]|nr:sigma-70 family RNA polymerase sigma factor [Candidatus Omnitrophota bacterium]